MGSATSPGVRHWVPTCGTHCLTPDARRTHCLAGFRCHTGRRSMGRWTRSGRDARLALLAGRQAGAFSFAQAMEVGFPRSTIGDRAAPRGVGAGVFRASTCLAGPRAHADPTTCGARCWRSDPRRVITHETLGARAMAPSGCPSIPSSLTVPHGGTTGSRARSSTRSTISPPWHRTALARAPDQHARPERSWSSAATQPVAVIGRVADDLVRLAEDDPRTRSQRSSPRWRDPASRAWSGSLGCSTSEATATCHRHRSSSGRCSRPWTAGGLPAPCSSGPACRARRSVRSGAWPTRPIRRRRVRARGRRPPMARRASALLGADTSADASGGPRRLADAAVRVRADRRGPRRALRDRRRDTGESGSSCSAEQPDRRRRLLTLLAGTSRRSGPTVLRHEAMRSGMSDPLPQPRDDRNLLPRLVVRRRGTGR